MSKIQNNQRGAAALLATIIITAAVVTIILSVVSVSINNRKTVDAFTDAIQSFYSSESGVTESLFQVRKRPDVLTFDQLIVNNVPVQSEYTESGGTCSPPPECEFEPGTGWWGEYFNYSASHPDMQVDPYPGPTPTPTEHDWYDDVYKTHEEIDADLNFGDNWFPYDGTAWENNEGYSHDYHFGGHWRARVTAPTAGSYAYSLGSDDDQWVLVGGVVIVNNSGTHAYAIKTGTIALAAGDNLVEIYFAERHTVGSAMSFAFDNGQGLIITPWPEDCGDTFECSSDFVATASTTDATRQVQYSCSPFFSNCSWRENIP